MIDGLLCLEFSHDPGQRGPVVVKLGFLHAALSVVVVEKREDIVERLLGIIQHVGECPALTVLKEVLTGDRSCRHSQFQSKKDVRGSESRVTGARDGFRSADAAFTRCMHLPGKGKVKPKSTIWPAADYCR